MDLIRPDIVSERHLGDGGVLAGVPDDQIAGLGNPDPVCRDDFAPVAHGNCGAGPAIPRGTGSATAVRVGPHRQSENTASSNL